MIREEALRILKENVKNQNLIKHSLAVEAAMGKLAEKFGQDKKEWRLAGLLHDIDYEKTKENPSRHSLLGAEMLENLGLEKDICQAVKVHNSAHGIEPQSLMEKALFCVDPLTGLIVASCLVLPSKKLSDLKVENVLHRFKEKSFAKGADREIIKKCQEYLDLTLEEFVNIVLEAMKEISKDLGL